MRVYIRVDASIDIGSGHVMRCLTLANALKEKDAIVSFISRDLPGNLIPLIKKENFDVSVLPFKETEEGVLNDHNEYARWLGTTWENDVCETLEKINSECDLLIVDHYGLNFQWEKKVREKCKKILVIDDLANRKHDCDILLDQNYYRDFENRYQGKLPENCKQLLGPKYVLMRSMFKKIQKKRKKLTQNKQAIIKNVLVFMGGSDPNNVTLTVLKSFPDESFYGGYIHVVVGKANPHKTLIRDFCANDSRMFYHCQPTYYDTLLINADWSISAGGGSLWERLYIGLPSTFICIAENQRQQLEDLSQLMDNQYFYIDKLTELSALLQYILTLQVYEMSEKQSVLANMIMPIEFIANQVIHWGL